MHRGDNRQRRPIGLHAVLVAVCAAPGFLATPGAAQPFLLKDTNPRTEELGSSLDLFAVVGDRVFFNGDDGMHGKELWVTDGTEQGTRLVRDIWPGPNPSLPTRFASFRDRLLFVADDGQHGHELWVSDGTEDGTLLVLDIIPGTDGLEPFIYQWNERVFLQAGAEPGGRRLWETDGTPEGTRKILPDLNLLDVLPSDGRYLLLKGGGISTPELWVSDGTTDGSRFVAQAEGGWMAGVHVFFWPTWSESGIDLHVSDGTPAGTRFLRRISGRAWWFRPVGDRLFLGAADTQLQTTIWVSDGTAEGTVVVRSGMSMTFPIWPIVFGQSLVFPASDTEHGEELWVADGTDAGTRILLDVEPGSTGSQPRPRSYEPGSPAVFSARTDEHGWSLWGTDGTEAGTRFLARLPVPAEAVDVDPWWLWGVWQGNRFVFPFNDGVHGMEPWVLDLADGSMRLVANIYQLRSGLGTPRRFLPAGELAFIAPTWCSGGSGGMYATDGTPEETRLLEGFVDVLQAGSLGDRSYFVGVHDQHGTGLWAIDGASEVPQLLAGGIDPTWLIAGGNRVFYSTPAAGGADLWVSDGTQETTRLLRRFHALGDPWSRIVSANGTALFFWADDGEHGKELWTSDGTLEGTQIVRDLVPGVESSGDFDFSIYKPLATIGSLLLFELGSDLWVSDGREAGTRVLKDFEGMQWGNYRQGPVRWGDRLAFVPIIGAGAVEVWLTDGTPEGTRALSPASSIYEPRSLAVAGDHLFFLASDVEGNTIVGTSLWVSDGTDEGTRRVADASWAYLLPAGHRVFFWNLESLWVSDGTAAGTQELMQGFNRLASVPVQWAATLDQRLYFWGFGPSALFTSDGTLEGTQSVDLGGVGFADCYVGPIRQPSVNLDLATYTQNPPRLWPERNLLLFSGDDGLSGPEPWAVPLGDAPAPRFIRADANADGTIDISDAVRTLETLFLTTEPLPCAAAGDANADGRLDISDAIWTLAFLFLGGWEPAPPFAGCGPESLPRERAIDCATQPAGCR